MPLTGPGIIPTAAAAVDRRTFGDCKAELARPFNPDDATMLAIAGESLNSALRAYNRFLWPWEVLTQNISLVSGTDAYALDTPFKKPLSLYYTQSSRRSRRIVYQPYDTFIQEYGLKSDGSPTVYTMRNEFETGQLIVYPRPINSDTAVLDYYRNTPSLQRDEVPIEMPEYALESAMQWAWFEMYKRVRGKGDMVSGARRDAFAARAELVAFCALRGDQVGVR